MEELRVLQRNASPSPSLAIDLNINLHHRQNPPTQLKARLPQVNEESNEHNGKHSSQKNQDYPK
jgi:hypothetical protein